MQQHTKSVAAVGFEPTPQKRLVPKTSALDHSATLPLPIQLTFETINECHGAKQRKEQSTGHGIPYICYFHMRVKKSFSEREDRSSLLIVIF